MQDKRYIICGNAPTDGIEENPDRDLRLRLWGKDGPDKITLRIEDIHKKMSKDVPDSFQDLLEIATYVYSADQAIPRGADDVDSFGQRGCAKRATASRMGRPRSRAGRAHAVDHRSTGRERRAEEQDRPAGGGIGGYYDGGIGRAEGGMSTMQYDYVSLEPIFQASLRSEPVIWIDHTGRPLKLSQMETSHLVNIMRRVVNAWAVSKGVAPIPIPNPVACIAEVESLSVLLRARLFGQEIRRRLDAGEVLSPAYARIWAAVLDKARELLSAEVTTLPENTVAAKFRIM